MGATATLMVTATTNSVLAKRLREVVIHHPGPRGTSLKILERPGRPVMSSLRRNPLEALGCHDQDCPLTMSGKQCNNNCRTENILYTANCTRCQQIPSIYIGETSQTLGVRTSQHKDDYKKASKETNPEGTSFMYDHSKYFHPENEIDINNDYEFNILEKHKVPMTRQLTEAIRIEEAFDKNNH